MIFKKNLEKLSIESEAVEMFLKEKLSIVKSSIENIDAKNENQESKELPDLIRQQNCVFKKKMRQRMQSLKY